MRGKERVLISRFGWWLPLGAGFRFQFWVCVRHSTFVDSDSMIIASTSFCFKTSLGFRGLRYVETRPALAHSLAWAAPDSRQNWFTIILPNFISHDEL